MVDWFFTLFCHHGQIWTGLVHVGPSHLEITYEIIITNVRGRDRDHYPFGVVTLPNT
jgi:hypothetical protein